MTSQSIAKILENIRDAQPCKIMIRSTSGISYDIDSEELIETLKTEDIHRVFNLMRFPIHNSNCDLYIEVAQIEAFSF